MAACGRDAMTRSTLELLACPHCGGRLRADITESVADRGWTGHLECASCNAHFNVQRGVARFPSAPAEADVVSRTRRTYDYTWTHVARREIADNWEKDSDQYVNLIPPGLIGGKMDMSAALAEAACSATVKTASCFDRPNPWPGTPASVGSNAASPRSAG